ncbi:myozenin-1a isoform X2 [Syngnathoides biaculeatus]|uniref:myozenin-1a isoform X2 n=1 Tax=Syngnathoides biaculeatus TaxID=300417 RepID=UPI002ADE812A|nr:myozenin-1a isoform X2 [Syngnathoides biaculeatus]
MKRFTGSHTGVIDIDLIFSPPAAMPARTPTPISKRKKATKVIVDLSKISQDEFEPVVKISEFDLGRKIGTPKDIMLEELSLLKNKGSKMFKMRQQRVEKFIYENNPDVFVGDSDELQKFVPTVGGHTIHLGGYLLSKDASQRHYGGMPFGGGGPVPPPKPGNEGGEAGGVGGGAQRGKDGLHGGSGEGSTAKDGGGKDAASKMAPKTYISPWEKAMKGDEGLLATLKWTMPGPVHHIELRKYKCFNRTAMPYGGFEKALQFMKFQMPDTEKTKVVAEPTVVYGHEINLRPSFNRTPIGWVGSGEPSSIHVDLDSVPYDGETEEL